MKTNAMANLAALSLMVSLFSQQVANAQGSSTHGGDPTELAEFTAADGSHLDSWYAVKQDLLRGMQSEAYKNLDLNGINPIQFSLHSVDTINKAKVEFDSKNIVVNGVNRVCENFIDLSGEPRIHCNREAYAQAMQGHDAETQYKLIGHEYISLAGFEPNAYGSSDYPISSQISKSLQKLEVKRWAVNSPTRDHGIRCRISQEDGVLGVGRWLEINTTPNGSRILINRYNSTDLLHRTKSKIFQNINRGAMFLRLPADQDPKNTWFNFFPNYRNAHFKVSLDALNSLDIDVVADSSGEHNYAAMRTTIDGKLGKKIFKEMACTFAEYDHGKFTINKDAGDYRDSWNSDEFKETLFMQTLHWLEKSQ